jgi:hypothetical protein
MPYYVPGVVFCVPMLTYVSYTVDLLAGFSVWLASTESDFARRGIPSAIWDVD